MFGNVSFAKYPGSGIISTTPASRCGEGSVVLHAVAGSGTIKWYTVPFYGTPITQGVSTDGTTFTTPSLVVTTTYYVDAVGTDGCSLNIGNTRVPVVATISTSSMQASIFYSSTTFCKSVNTAQEVTRTGTDGGTYTYTGEGTLALNSSTGAIIPSTSDVGIYTVTYTVTPGEGCIENPASTTITITNAPLTSSISYTGSPFCTTATSETVNLTNDNGGTFSASPSGLSINSSTGKINPSQSLPGTYTVTYFVPGAGGCEPQSATTSVTITGLPTVAFIYSGTQFCIDNSNTQSPTLTGTGAYTGGSYSYSGTGTLSLNTSTGAITPGSSTAGTYTITYSVPASGNCSTVTANTTVTISPLPTASISGDATVCQNDASPNITFTGTTGTAPYTFIYKVNNGGNKLVTTTSGNSVNVAQTTVSAGTYAYTLVSVSDANGCSQSAEGTATIIVNGTPNANFTYTGSPFCKSGTVSPVFASGASAGVFTSEPEGVVFDEGGTINLASTPSRDYTITNTISTCGTPVSHSESITIMDLPTATISGDLTACGTTVLTAKSNAASPTYIWYKNNVVIPDEVSSTLTVAINGDYKVKVTDGTTYCENTSAASTVTLSPLPTVSITSESLQSCGGSITLTANATDVTYQWYKQDILTGDYGAISEATGSTYNATESGYYEVIVNNGTCSNTSDPVFVTISIQINPGDINGGTTVCTGDNITTLTLDLTDADKKGNVLQWESSTNAGETWETIENTKTTYVAEGLTQTTLYRAQVQNGACDPIYSNTATVTVNPDPTISAQPVASTTECIGGTNQLSVTAADGTGAYTYQWYSNSTNANSGGTPIEAATASTFTPPTTGAGTIYYYVIVGDNGSGCGTATSDVAAVTTVADPVWTIDITPSTSIAYGSSVTFHASVTNDFGGTVSWIRSNTPGGAGTTVTSPDTPPAAGTYYYRPHFSGTVSGCNLADGTETTVTVNPKALTITAKDVTKTYGTAITGGTGSAEFTSSGLVGEETIGSVTIAYGTGSAATDAAGTYNGKVTASAATGGSFVASNYAITYNAGNITVQALQLTIENPALTTDKTYDGNTSAVVTAGALTNVVGSDDVSVTATATYDDATIASGKTITVVYSFSTSNSNYTLPSNYSVTTGVIRPAAPTGAATQSFCSGSQPL